MHLTLLSRSIDSSKSHSSHPAFVEILRQITPFEAQLVNQLLLEPNFHIARVILAGPINNGTGELLPVTPVRNHLLSIIDTETEECSSDSRIELMIENFIRLGLINVDYNHSYDDDEYQWAYTHPIFLSLYKRGNDGYILSNDEKFTFKVGLQFGTLNLTSFDKHFAVSIGINNSIHSYSNDHSINTELPSK